MATTVERLKEHGNSLYARGKFLAAVDVFTEAITLEPGVVVLYTNRALSFLKLSKWEAAASDCLVAVERDPANYKAKYLLGKAWQECGRFEDAVVQLELSLALARKKTAISTVETVAEELHRARCKLWHARHASAHFRARRLREHLSRALACYRDRCVAEAEAEAEAKEERHADMLALHAELEADAMSLVDHMVSKSSKVGAAPGAADVEAPDYFCGPISMELLRDPVVTPSGHTYERSVLMEHLKHNPIDPLTRVPLDAEALYPNTALRSAIQQFLLEDPWPARPPRS